MGDQQLYKTNHVAHGSENLFYQQPPLGVHSGLSPLMATNTPTPRPARSGPRSLPAVSYTSWTLSPRCLPTKTCEFRSTIWPRCCTLSQQ
uniref:Transcriptional regulating factor 1 n=1 Tax=Homo sapiens TaxID=9606 RepID=A0A8Q3WKV2_HUMAN